MMNDTSLAEVLRSVGLLQVIADAQVEEIASVGEMLEFAHGRVIFVELERAEHASEN